LFDEFYKEYAKFMIEARTARQTVRMELADLLAIDDTVWMEVGDVTGLLSKLQFTVSVKDGLGPTKLELLYI
jgi:hypothetical protein